MGGGLRGGAVRRLCQGDLHADQPAEGRQRQHLRKVSGFQVFIKEYRKYKGIFMSLLFNFIYLFIYLFICFFV